jgi:alkylated DNA nucleotide flippase Atl1
MLQRRRELQLAALRREGILLEDEYREDIRYYMYEMEVC